MTRLIVAFGTLLTALALLLSPAAAQSDGESDDPPPDSNPEGVVQVLKVSGLLDPVMVSFIEDEVRTAEESGVTVVVLQINSTGDAVSDDELDELVDTIESATVPVAAWVGPSGSKAEGDTTRLLAAADVTGVAPGSRIEVSGDLVAARLESGSDLEGKTSVGEKIGAELATDLDLVDNDAPIIGQFIVDLPGVETRVVDNHREPVTTVRFGQLSLVDQMFHTVASPAVAYLLFIIGGCLLVFELFTAGIGVAGVVGAGSLVLSAYGLAVLPTNTWAIVALGLCFVAFAVDVQTGVPRLWSGVATVLLVVGSIGLFTEGSPSWITFVAGIGGAILGMIAGMPPMVRTRFSTPTIGRDWMIGETGVAVAGIDPDGVVNVRDSPWRAHTNRATPIAAGDHVRVTAIDGMVLEVEPLEGAAQDYRRH